MSFPVVDQPTTERPTSGHGRNGGFRAMIPASPTIPPTMHKTAPAAPTTETDETKPPVPARRVRSELNLEQWSIWFPARSNRDPGPRVLTREITTGNGEKIAAEVEITASRKGTLTTEDQRTYYALVEHHQRNERREGIVYFSLRGLSKSLAKRWGTGTIETITDSLTRLRANTIIWRHAYHDAGTGKAQEELGFFNIITDLKIVTAKRDGHVTRAEGYFKLNDAIIANLEQNHTKPVLLDVVLKFKSETAQILYTQLDRILSKDITTYERRTKELFADLGLEGRKYNQPSGRKQQLKPAIAELEGVPLSNGFVIQSATLERTADQKDYKLVIRRGRTRVKNGAPEPRFGESQVEPQPSKNPAAQGRTEANPAIPTEGRKGIELLAYFHTVFFGTETLTTQPAQKHRDLADWMITSHGEELSRYIVDFAKSEAEKTRFAIATFGAIANYVDRGVSSFTLEQARLKREEEARREDARRVEVERLQEARQQRGYGLLRALSNDERNFLLGQKRAELIVSEKWRKADFSDDLFRLMFEKEAEEKVRQDLLALD